MPGPGATAFGQVEGHTVTDVLAWLATIDLDRRKGIGYVAIDMSATYAP